MFVFEQLCCHASKIAHRLPVTFSSCDEIEELGTNLEHAWISKLTFLIGFFFTRYILLFLGMSASYMFVSSIM